MTDRFIFIGRRNPWLGRIAAAVCILPASAFARLAPQDPAAWHVYSEPLGTYTRDDASELASLARGLVHGAVLEQVNLAAGALDVLAIDQEYHLRPPVGAARTEGSFVEFLPPGAALREVRVWADELVRGVQLVVAEGGAQGALRALDVHGVAAGAPAAFVLEPGEALREIRGAIRPPDGLGPGIEHLEFVTNRRTSARFGARANAPGHIAIATQLRGEEVFATFTGSVGSTLGGEGLIAIGIDSNDVGEQLYLRFNKPPYGRRFQRVAPGEYRELPGVKRVLRFDPESGKERFDWRQDTALGALLQFEERGLDEERPPAFRLQGQRYVEARPQGTVLPAPIAAQAQNIAFLHSGIDGRHFDALDAQPGRGASRGRIFATESARAPGPGWQVCNDWSGRRVHLRAALVTCAEEHTRAALRTVVGAHLDLSLGRDNAAVVSRAAQALEKGECAVQGEAWMLGATLRLDRSQMALDPAFEARLRALAALAAESARTKVRGPYVAAVAALRADYGTHYVRSVTFGRRESYRALRPCPDRRAADAWRSEVQAHVTSAPFDTWGRAGSARWETRASGNANEWVPLYFELGVLGDLALAPYNLGVGAELNGSLRDVLIADERRNPLLSRESALPFAPLAAFGAAQGWDAARHLRGVADVDGDQRADVYGFNDSGLHVAFSTGAGFEAPVTLTPQFGRGLGVRTDPRIFGDVEGNRSADLVVIGRDGVIRVLLSRGAQRGFWPAVVSPAHFRGWDLAATDFTIADVSGDGKGDLVAFGPKSLAVLVSDGRGGFAAPKSYDGFHRGRSWDPRSQFTGAADIDGDGKADVMGIADGVYVAFSTGKGLEPPQKLWGYYFEGTYQRYLADVDGDTRADLVAYSAQAPAPEVAFSEGRRFPFRRIYADSILGAPAGWNPAHPRALGDVDGGGALEIVGFGQSGVVVERLVRLRSRSEGLMPQ